MLIDFAHIQKQNMSFNTPLGEHDFNIHSSNIDIKQHYPPSTLKTNKPEDKTTPFMNPEDKFQLQKLSN